MSTIVLQQTPVRVSHANRPQHTYYPALDGLRAVAFLLVFCQHYLSLPWGFTGVDCFFVLSGFLITGILYDSQNSPNRVRNFFMRRSLRIFPLYYGLLLVLLLSYPIFHWKWTAAWLAWPTYLGNYLRFNYSFISGSPRQLLADAQLGSRTFPHIVLYMGHFWSLCVEEQFYLVWPWIVWRVRDLRKLTYICLATVITGPVLRMLIDHWLSPALRSSEILYRTTPLRVDALLLGGLIALLVRAGWSERLIRIASFAFPSLLIAAVLWHGLHPALWIGMKHGIAPNYVFTWALSFFDVLFASALILALHPGSYVYRFLKLSPLRWIGRISYGAYVFHDILHVPINLLFEHRRWHWHLQAAIAALAFTLVLASLSYRFYETPFIRLKERWSE